MGSSRKHEITGPVVTDHGSRGADRDAASEALIELGITRLGLWLEEKVEIIVATSFPAYRGALAEESLRDQLTHIRRLLTGAAARWLITRDPVEARARGSQAFLAYGSLAAHDGVSHDELTKRLLRWRDDVIAGLSHAAGELGVSAAALEQAVTMVRRNADVTMVRMTEQFEADRGTKHRLLVQREQELMHAATHDTVTGLLNRSAFGVQLGALINGFVHRGEQIAVLIVDLDHFELFADTFGPTEADHILRLLGDRLQGTVRSHEILAHLDADTFGIIVHAPHAATDAIDLAERIRVLLSQSFPLSGTDYVISATIGIAIGPEHGWDADVLLAHAGCALHYAQHTNRSCSLYQDGDSNTVALLTLVHDLRQALHDDQLALHYQPKLDLATNEIVAVDTVIRWQHPRLAFLDPGQLFSAAETAGLVADIAKAVIDKALGQTAKWRAAAFDLDISIDLSAIDVSDPVIVEHLATILTRTGVPAERVILTVAVTDRPAVRAALDAVTTLGVRVSLADFGTAYGAVAQLTELPLHEVRIDSTFLAGEVRTPSLAVVAALTTLGHALGHSVVAQGVQDPTILAALQEVGCDHVQGCAVSPPLPVHKLRAWLSNRAATIGLTSMAIPTCIQTNRSVQQDSRSAGSGGAEPADHLSHLVTRLAVDLVTMVDDDHNPRPGTVLYQAIHSDPASGSLVLFNHAKSLLNVPDETASLVLARLRSAISFTSSATAIIDGQP